MKRVLQIIGGLNRAGAETMLMNLYRVMDKSNMQFDFLIYTDKKQDYEDEIQNLGGRIIRISVHGITSHLQYIYKIRKVIQEYGPYVAIHIHTLHNGAFALLAAKPFNNIVKVMHSHCTQNGNNGIFFNIYERVTLNIIRKYSDKCIACGSAAGKYLFGERFEKEGIILKNGILASEYVKDYSNEFVRLRKEFSISKEDLIIGCIGRLENVKNHIFVLDIASVLRDQGIPFKILIVGEGSLMRSLEQRIKEYGLEKKVVLTGMRTDIPVLLQLMNIFLMPSLYEGLPVTLVEAQAAGRVCLASDAITDEVDLEINLMHFMSLEDSAEAWAKKICELAEVRRNDKENIAKEICARGYDSKQNTDLLYKIYTQLE